MTGIILTMASAGVMCAAGVGFSSMFKWFHSYEIDIDTSKKTRGSVNSSHPHSERLKSLGEKIKNK